MGGFVTLLLCVIFTSFIATYGKEIATSLLRIPRNDVAWGEVSIYPPFWPALVAVYNTRTTRNNSI